ncbi:G-type lectin S-receptor serine/threonine-protein kinase [Salix suchowensis]|nr:G-type lectin S-receptor serine/threonine-protein kinase [Salix suchowensis]
MYDFSTIGHATNNFSSSNKLGEGGFGPVYRGTVVDGQEIAGKRLSKSSGQGMDEFKNEVMLIAKLQHRNLVKLLGFCIHKDEKMLIYEYMPNKSLDSIIFVLTRNKLLDWSRLIHIIGGIARGLVYLHQDSRLRIIHRDIKASNILLDNELNPKISDFGLARMFGGDQAEANTNRVYALDGHFSVKSDVFSFGVLVLEIVSGKKNRGFCHPDQNLNLLGHAWVLWTKGAQLDLIDEFLRCIHVALLCVQQRPEDRPTMSSVVVMLGSENPLPQPKQPGFFMGKNPPEQGSSSSKHESYSANEVTLTSLDAR